MARGYCDSIPCSQVRPSFLWLLGIGANTAIFQLLDAVRLRTLPVKNPQEIARVVFDRRGSRSGNFSTRYPDFTYAIWEQIRDKQEGFSSVYAWAPVQFNVSPAGEVHNVQGLFVSGEFFETLGVEPALGRLLSTADDQPSCASAGAVLSYSYWQQEYGGRRDVLDGKVTINRHPDSDHRRRQNATFTEWKLDGTSTWRYRSAPNRSSMVRTAN